MEEAEYQIQNTVLTLSYRGTEFDLEELREFLEGARYDPEMYPGLIYKSVEPKASFLIFTSGKANCVGAKSVEKAKRAIEELTDELRGLGLEVEEPKPEVQNIVASVDFKRKIDLERMVRKFRNTEYEPEVFPGLVFWMEGSNVTFLLFASGNGTCVGATEEKEIEEAISKLSQIIV